MNERPVSESMRRVFDDLCHWLHVEPEHDGEVYTTCPFCGAEGTPRDPRFSFREFGGHCFVCQGSANVYGLAKAYQMPGADGLSASAPTAPRRPAPVRREKRALPPVDFEALTAKYETDYRKYEGWRQYRAMPEPLVDAYRLGYGQFPMYTSQCQDNRLMVPLITGGRVVGIRGRNLGCEHGKWLSPRGNQFILFNGGCLGQGLLLGDRPDGKRAAGRQLFITENPIDALLLEHLYPDVCAVATLGVTYWKDEWYDLIRKARPSLVWVAFDNDRPGNGGGPKGRELWLQEHKLDLEPNGVKLVNALLEVGIKARLMPYPEDAPYKMDIGDLIKIKRMGVTQ